MHVTRPLLQWLSNHTVIGHRARELALVKLLQALLKGSQLSLTQLGRHRAGSAYEKHHIKASDRLLANQHLHAERDGIYRAIARTLLGGIKRPVIIVGWSDSEPRRQWLAIKAAAAVGGRAISLYEKVYPMKRYNSPRTHREFLLDLKAVLPEGCTPIVVTDAGFRGPSRRACQVSPRTHLSSAASRTLADRYFAAPRTRQLAKDQAAVRSTHADRRDFQGHEVSSLGIWAALCPLQRRSPVGGAAFDRGFGVARAVVARPLRKSARLVASLPS
jgi:hypothetical protein